MASVQFTGLASGLDTDSIVKAMLTTQQSKIDSANQAKTKAEWKQDQWKTVNKSINEFYSKFIDKIKSKSTFEKYNVSSTSNAIKVSNSGSLPIGRHKLEVIQLATELNKCGDIDSTITSKSKSFKELGLLSDSQTTNLTVNDKVIEVTSSDTLATLEKKIKNADESLNVNFDIENKKLFISSKESGVKAKIDIEASGNITGLFEKIGVSGTNGICQQPQSVSKTAYMDSSVTSSTATLESMGWMTDASTSKINVNGHEIEITKDDSLESIGNKIHSVDANLNVTIDASSKTFNITTATTGSAAQLDLEVVSDPQGVFDKMGISGEAGWCDASGKLHAVGSWKIDEVGTGAQYKYNDLLLSSDTNEVEVNGLKITLYEKTTSPVYIDVESNPDEIVSFMKEFVDGYNKLISDLNDKYNATRITLEPLTDTQKESKTDKEIEDYEQDIKDSLLRRDPSLKKVIETLRNSLQGIVKNNDYRSLSAVGITTGNYYENGKLYLEESKLKKALQENPEAVSELFAGSGETYSTVEDGKNVTKTKEMTAGIGTNLYNAFLEMKKRIQDVKSYDSYYNDKIVDVQVKDYKEKIDTLQDKYESLKKMYYKKFTAMETALSKLNSQGQSFTNMLG